MKCPRTGTELKEVEINGVKLDISEACGGVWLDNFELNKFDEIHETAGEELVALMEKYRNDNFDPARRLRSPRHPEVVMLRRFFSAKRQIEIDECPRCGGIWLDAGELAMIRKLFPTEEEKIKANEAFVEEVSKSAGFEEMLKESEESRKKARRIANMLRWFCPSFYMPGKQDWGAF